MARTPKPIEWDKVELFLKAGAQQKKIAQSLGIDEDTLRRRVEEKYGEDYAVYAASLRNTGELLLEATQFKKAMEGNISMLIWLGKIRLNQKEPESISQVPPMQNEIDKDHKIMELEHKLSQYESDADKS